MRRALDILGGIVGLALAYAYRAFYLLADKPLRRLR